MMVKEGRLREGTYCVLDLVEIQEKEKEWWCRSQRDREESPLEGEEE